MELHEDDGAVLRECRDLLRKILRVLLRARLSGETTRRKKRKPWRPPRPRRFR